MAFNPWEQYNSSLANLGQAVTQLGNQDLQRGAQARQNSLADLQIQQGNMEMTDKLAKQGAVEKLYGVDNPTDAYSAQLKQAQTAELQKQATEKQKAAGDIYTRTAGLLEKGVVTPEVATNLFHHDLKGLGIDLKSQGMDFSFKTDAGYYSGKVTPQTLFMMNGKPTPYGSEGVIENAKVSGLTPEGVPIFEMSKDTKFKEPDKKNETWSEPYAAVVGGKKVMLQKSSTGQIKPVVQDSSSTTHLTINGSTTDQVQADKQAIMAGQLAPSALGKRNGHDAKVRAAIIAEDPNFNFTQAEANAKYSTNSGNLNTRALIQGVEPLYNKLLETGKTLSNTTVPGVNRVVNWVKEQRGNPDIVAFNNLRDDTIAESERVRLGSGVLSDSKYLRAVKNVNSAQSYPQLQAAVAQMRLAVKSRLEALDKKPYPGATPNNERPQAQPPRGIKSKSDPLGIL